MEYYVEFVSLVLDYLAGIEGLTDEDREAIVAAVTEELSHNADHFFALYPLTHEALCFRYNYPHPTATTLYDFDFVVSAHHLEMGIVRVVYVEHTTHPMP
jgi:hypothetical protein